MPAIPNRRQLRDAFGAFPTGVTVVSGFREDGVPVGITANSFTSVSLEPPLIAWCLADGSTSRSAFKEDADFAVTILGKDQRDVALHFASRQPQKFHGKAGGMGSAPTIPGGICRLECRTVRMQHVGDHLLIIGHVYSVDRLGGEPLVFYAGRFGHLERDAKSPEVDIWATFGGAWE